MVDPLSIGGLLLAFFLVFMNGVFVAAAFTFVKLRPTQISALVEEGTPGASLVTQALENLDDYGCGGDSHQPRSLGLSPVDSYIHHIPKYYIDNA